MVKIGKRGMSILASDLLGGFAAMLVTLPSGIAFGLIVYSPLGPEFASQGALMGILGTIALGLVSPLFGGTARLITAPCAPAAAVLAAFSAEFVKRQGAELSLIPIYIALIALLAGIMELLLSALKGGRFIKYIPYPVVSGYLSGVGILIMIGQLPKFLGLPKGSTLFEFGMWNPKSIVIGSATILVMIFSSKIIKKVPAAIVSFSGGIATYWILSLLFPELATLKENALVIGSIEAKFGTSFFTGMIDRWMSASDLNFENMTVAIYTASTLAVLLSIDTLKTCVVVDALTKSAHEPNKELRGQGIGNIATGLVFGMPGAGTMGATLININSGGITKYSGFFEGVFALLAFLILAPFVAWVPIPVLSGILMVGAYRILDKQSIKLLKQKSTVFDFLVVISVVVTAIAFNLITASGVGIALAIFLFLREQVRSSVISRKTFGNQIFSKKKRLKDQLNILLENGHKTAVYELQGSLFFGTTDHLYTEIEPSIQTCRFIILDFKRVVSIDYTATHRLEQIADQLSELGGILIFTSLHEHIDGKQNIKKYLEEIEFFKANRKIMIFEELDPALEWVEDELIRRSGYHRVDEEKMLAINEISLFLNIDEDILKPLNLYIKERTFKKGETVFTRGEEGDEIFFIRKGTVRIVLPLEKGGSHVLAIFGRGDFFGDMCFIGNEKRERDIHISGNEKRSANAIADGEVSLFILTRKDFDRMALTYPKLASHFYEELARAIALRLRQTNTELKALQEA